MNPTNESNEINNPENLLELFLKGDEKVYDLALESDSHFTALSQLEESVHVAIKYESAKYLGSLVDEDSPFFENLDIAKANSLISKSKNISLPIYLQNYMDADFSSQKEADKLVIRFGKAGMKLLGSFFNDSLITPLELSIPSVRNSIKTVPQSISMLE